MIPASEFIAGCMVGAIVGVSLAAIYHLIWSYITDHVGRRVETDNQVIVARLVNRLIQN